jgi:hypothetical protein
MEVLLLEALLAPGAVLLLLVVVAPASSCFCLPPSSPSLSLLPAPLADARVELLPSPLVSLLPLLLLFTLTARISKLRGVCSACVTGAAGGNVYMVKDTCHMVVQG